MCRSQLPSLHIHNNSLASHPQDEDTSAISLLQMGHEVPKRSWFTTTGALRLTSVILHSVLFLIHSALVVVWFLKLETFIIVDLEHQKRVSFLISATTTAFATTYSALLVFVTQTLSTRRSLQIDQMLTATHDNAAAWAGVGAAISHLWLQKTSPTRASIIGVITAALYLSTILDLHITTSSLFSLVLPTLDPVDLSHSQFFDAPTYGLPSNPDDSDITDPDSRDAYAKGSLYFLPSILDSPVTHLGLYGGTLYDVLNIDPLPGYAVVNAWGFNITCGYVVDVSELLASGDRWETADHTYSISRTQPGMISAPSRSSSGSLADFHDIVLYSTIPIVDSNLTTGPLINLSPPMNTSVSYIQLFRCSLSLENLRPLVDTQFRQSEQAPVGLNITKTASTWAAYVPPPTSVTSNDNSLIDSWAEWYDLIPASDFPLVFGSEVFTSVADIYLIQKLNLPAANHNSTQNVTLHEVENALSNIVAAMFWTLGHIRPTYRSMVYSSDQGLPNGTFSSSLSDLPQSPILLQGNAIVTEAYTQAQLELSIIAVTAGLVISVILSFLASPSLKGSDEMNPPVNGTGILHAIWMYRNHPELDVLLKQVEYPTDDNLRAAGLVQTRLVGELAQKQWKSGAS